ncbi:MAG: NAD(P)/FAD-dependent oxidoreductase [Myxococcota bacterium]
MPDYDAIVIGSGAGGLTAAVALARAGCRVIVFEQHYLPGGWCHSFNRGGYQFSPGIHYIGGVQPGGLMRRLYEGLGVSGDLTFMELNPDAIDHLQIGGARFDVPRGRAAFGDRLKGRFPAESRGIDAYLAYCEGMSDQLLSTFPPETASDLVRMPWRLRRVLRHGMTSLDRYLRQRIADPTLRAWLSMQSGNYALPPDEVSLVQHAAVISHYFDGGFYPRGGGRALPRAFLRALRRHGGEIKVRSPVAEILVAGRQVRGVRLADGSAVSAPIVISNADPGVTYGKLLSAEHLDRATWRRLRRTRYSVAALSLFFAVDADLRGMGLDSGNYWYVHDREDIHRLYAVARDPDPTRVESMPFVFLTVTSLKDPTKRSPGQPHTCEAFTFVNYDAFQRWVGSDSGARKGDYQRLKARLKARMLSRLEAVVPGISAKVVFSELGTPLTNAHFVASSRGSLYGTEKVLSNIGPFAFSTRGPVPGLFLCGASTLGHGVAAASLSGLTAAAQSLGVRRGELLNADGPPLKIYQSEDPTLWPQTEQKMQRTAQPSTT